VQTVGAGVSVRPMQINDSVKHAHRPHPGKEAKKYRIEQIRAWLSEQGIQP
jgi:hypothetical protein